MRKIPAALAALALVAVGLVGCTATGPAACTRTAESEPAVMDLITVSGDASSAPEVDAPAPLRIEQGGYRDIIAGDGTPISSVSQLVVLDVTIVNGQTGETAVATPYDGDLSRVFALSRWSQGFPTFETALHCAAEGSRVAIALAPGDLDPETATGLGLEEDDPAIAVVDVRKVYLSRAQGALQFNSGNGLPAVVRAPDGRPGVTIPDAAPPSSTVVQTLIKGDGPVVTGDDPVRVHYTGLTWADKSVFQTTWDAEPASIGLDSVVKGFAQAVKGQTVGSQVMVVVPPKDGYGDKAQGSIPADSTLVFVVDILGIDPPAAQ